MIFFDELGIICSVSVLYIFVSLAQIPSFYILSNILYHELQSISWRIKNKGEEAGAELCQAYMSRKYAVVGRVKTYPHLPQEMAGNKHLHTDTFIQREIS